MRRATVCSGPSSPRLTWNCRIKSLISAAVLTVPPLVKGSAEIVSRATGLLGDENAERFPWMSSYWTW